MTDEAALIAAVLKFPVEDTPRLGYADWLDEQAGTVECGNCKGTGVETRTMPDGSPAVCYGGCSGTGRVSDGRAARAEFIRVQVELARLEPCNIFALAHGNLSPSAVDRTCDCRWHALRRREEELFGPVSPCSVCAWHAPIQHWPLAKWEWSRGFVSAVEMDWNLWRTHAAAILAAQPIERVRLTDRPGLLELQRVMGRELMQKVLRDFGPVSAGVPISETRTKQFLETYWPRITFELPAEETLRLHGVAGDDGTAADLTFTNTAIVQGGTIAVSAFTVTNPIPDDEAS